jgi:hypothetical protein
MKMKLLIFALGVLVGMIVVLALENARLIEYCNMHTPRQALEYKGSR